MNAKTIFIVCVFLSLATTCFVYIVHMDVNASTPVTHLKYLGRRFDFAGMDISPSATTRVPLSSYNLENMTDVFRPYFRDRHIKNNSKVAIYMFSAVLREIAQRETDYEMDPALRFSHVVHFSGWEYGPHRRDQLKCCYIWDDRQVSEGTAPGRIYTSRQTLLVTYFESVHYKCTLNEPGRLRGSYVVPKRIKCADYQHRAIIPQVPLPAEKPSIGVCLKILYGNVDTKLLVDWIEYYKEMKVDTIITKTYHVSPVVQRILTNYASEGLLEVMPFEIPWRPIEKKPPLGLVQERVAILDCHERLHKHTYFTVLDLDEFLFPYQSKDLKTMLVNLTNQYPYKSGFRFESEMFIKDWGESNSNNGSDIVRYFQRLAPEINRAKFIALTSSIADGRVRTHNFNMGLTDRPVTVSSDVAAIKHYRLCYYNRVCNGTRYNDTSILTVVRRFEDRSARILKRLGTP